MKRSKCRGKDLRLIGELISAYTRLPSLFCTFRLTVMENKTKLMRRRPHTFDVENKVRGNGASYESQAATSKASDGLDRSVNRNYKY